MRRGPETDSWACNLTEKVWMRIGLVVPSLGGPSAISAHEDYYCVRIYLPSDGQLILTTHQLVGFAFDFVETMPFQHRQLVDRFANGNHNSQINVGCR